MKSMRRVSRYPIDIYHFIRDEHRRPAENARKAAEYEEWARTVTKDDIRALFLETLTEGNAELHMPILLPSELDHFDTLIASTLKDVDGLPSLTSVLNFLQKKHGAASTEALPLELLEILVQSHARFPFTDHVPLTRDALLRSVLLLTRRVDFPFKQASSSGGHVIIRRHAPERRLRFIFATMAGTLSAGTSIEDVMDVICRVKYPWGTFPKGLVARQNWEDLKGIAGRIGSDCAAEDEKMEPVAVEKLEPLVQLVTAITGTYIDSEKWTSIEVGFGSVEVVTLDEFVEWAEKVDLFDVLHDAFGPLFTEEIFPTIM